MRPISQLQGKRCRTQCCKLSGLDRDIHEYQLNQLGVWTHHGIVEPLTSIRANFKSEKAAKGLTVFKAATLVHDDSSNTTPNRVGRACSASSVAFRSVKC